MLKLFDKLPAYLIKSAIYDLFTLPIEKIAEFKVFFINIYVIRI